MDAATNALTSYGPLGAVVAVLFGIVVWLIKNNVKREERMSAVLETNNKVMQKLTDLLEHMEEKVQKDHENFQNLQQKTYNALISRPCQKGND